MSSTRRGKGLGLRIGVPGRGDSSGASPIMPNPAGPQALPMPRQVLTGGPQPLPLPQGVPLPLPPDPSPGTAPQIGSTPGLAASNPQGRSGTPGTHGTLGTANSSRSQDTSGTPGGKSGTPGSGKPRPPRGPSNRPSLAPLQSARQGSGRNLMGHNPISVFTPREDVMLEDLERLQPPLGFGSGGRVYKARHRKSGKEYALKIIQERYEEEVRRQIVQEMQILRRAHCSSIVECYGIFDSMGEISFVLELMDGGTLGDVVKRKGPIREQHVAEIARQVLPGVLYLHRQHVVHRDLKPSNLLINTSGQVKIADFGVSKELASSIAHCNTYVGTSAYLSPERINPEAGAGYDGYSSDVWSLGLTLLELALGKFPYAEAGQSANWMQLFGAIVYSDPPAAPDTFSQEFRSFIASCLQKDPRKRNTIAGLMEHPFCKMYREPQWMDLRSLM